jgi:hypothetical protein
MTRSLRTPEPGSHRSDESRVPTSDSADSLASLLRAALPPRELPGDAKARLLAAYARRSSGPASRFQLLLGGIRWSAAAASAAAAAVVVAFAGALAGGDSLPSSEDGVSGANGIVADAALATSAADPAADPSLGGRTAQRERALSWSRVHPLPSAPPRVRVVNDPNLPLIGVGWTPDLSEK